MEEKVEDPLKNIEFKPDNSEVTINRDMKTIRCSKFEKIEFLNPAERQKRFNNRYKKQWNFVEQYRTKRIPPEFLITGSSLDVFNCTKEEFNSMKRNLPLIRFEKSPIHQWGAFSATKIGAGEPIVEYTGVLIRMSVTRAREKYYEKHGNNGSYIFRLGEDIFIDATNRGGIARFLNHSCDPNCKTRIVNADGVHHVVIYAKRDIEPYEELTYDYRLPYESRSKAIVCNCGSLNCRGYLNYSELYDATEQSLQETFHTENTMDDIHYYED